MTQTRYLFCPSGLLQTRLFQTRLLLFILLIAGSFYCAIASADSKKIEVYTLQHQLADALLPTINGVLQDGESVNAYNNELIVNASPSSQRSVASLLQSLDKPMRSIIINVRNNNTASGTESGTSVSGGIRTGDVYLGAGGPVYREDRRDNGDLTVQHDGLRVQTNRQVRSTSTQQDQKLRAIEGTPAWISTGQAIPYRSVDRWGNPVVDYQNANRGFYVTARMMGNRVQLDISTSNDKLSEDPRKARRGVIDTEQLHSTVSGFVGEWIPLGGITLQGDAQGHSYTGKDSSSGMSVGDISVRVVPLD